MGEIAGGPSRDSPLVRPSARVVLFGPGDRVLLFRVTQPDRPYAEPFWITPGGGLEGEETYEECARRELREETGIEDFELGPCVWLREHTWPWGGVWIRSVERYFLARTNQDAVSRLYQTELEMQFLAEHRWWSLEEMRDSPERLVPAAFAELAVPLSRGTWSGPPVVVGE